jgi:hypothetical protein
MYPLLETYLKDIESWIQSTGSTRHPRLDNIVDGIRRKSTEASISGRILEPSDVEYECEWLDDFYPSIQKKSTKHLCLPQDLITFVNNSVIDFTLSPDHITLYNSASVSFVFQLDMAYEDQMDAWYEEKGIGMLHFRGMNRGVSIHQVLYAIAEYIHTHSEVFDLKFSIILFKNKYSGLFEQLGQMISWTLGQNWIDSRLQHVFCVGAIPTHVDILNCIRNYPQRCPIGLENCDICVMDRLKTVFWRSGIVNIRSIYVWMSKHFKKDTPFIGSMKLPEAISSLWHWNSESLELLKKESIMKLIHHVKSPEFYIDLKEFFVCWEQKHSSRFVENPQSSSETNFIFQDNMRWPYVNGNIKNLGLHDWTLEHQIPYIIHFLDTPELKIAFRNILLITRYRRRLYLGSIMFIDFNSAMTLNPDIALTPTLKRPHDVPPCKFRTNLRILQNDLNPLEKACGIVRGQNQYGAILRKLHPNDSHYHYKCGYLYLNTFPTQWGYSDLVEWFIALNDLMPSILRLDSFKEIQSVVVSRIIQTLFFELDEEKIQEMIPTIMDSFGLYNIESVRIVIREARCQLIQLPVVHEQFYNLYLTMDMYTKTISEIWYASDLEAEVYKIVQIAFINSIFLTTIEAMEDTVNLMLKILSPLFPTLEFFLKSSVQYPHVIFILSPACKFWNQTIPLPFINPSLENTSMMKDIITDKHMSSYNKYTDFFLQLAKRYSLETTSVYLNALYSRARYFMCMKDYSRAIEILSLELDVVTRESDITRRGFDVDDMYRNLHLLRARCYACLEHINPQNFTSKTYEDCLFSLAYCDNMALHDDYIHDCSIMLILSSVNCLTQFLAHDKYSYDFFAQSTCSRVGCKHPYHTEYDK